MTDTGMIHKSDAHLLSEVHKSHPIWDDSTPKWLLMLLAKKGIENDTFRINKAKCMNSITINSREYDKIKKDNIEYDSQPKEVELVPIETILTVPSKIHDIMNVPHNQMENQLKLTFDNIFECQEDYLINSPDDGLVQFCKNREKFGRFIDSDD